MKIILVVAARPNFVKMAPLFKEIKKFDGVELVVTHTGQHYDQNMSEIFFSQLLIPEPDYNLGVSLSTHSKQIAMVMVAFEKIINKERPDLVIVFGDVNSTLACSLVCSKSGVKLAHVEAGLRSHNWTMPEEINRVLTDRISDYLFTTSKNASNNLLKEGITSSKVHFVGNIMADTLIEFKKKAAYNSILEKILLETKKYFLWTMHRPSNVDNEENLNKFVSLISRLSDDLPIVFPLHPRCEKNLTKFNLISTIRRNKNIITLPAQGYLEFLDLMSNSRLVFTDSGGIQAETTILGVPCLTIRDDTEWQETMDGGTNVLAGTDPDKIYETYINFPSNSKKAKKPKYWDGKTASRITKVLLKNHESK